MSSSKKIKIEEKNKEPRSSGENKKELLSSEGVLAVDVYETDSDFVVLSAIAGVSTEDIDISVDKDMLIIKGSRENPAAERKKCFQQECYWGQFSRKIILPEYVNPSEIEASITRGILSIKFPKKQPEDKKKINIKE